MKLFSLTSVKRALVQFAIPSVVTVTLAGQVGAAAQDRKYTLSYRGTQDSLTQGTEPGTYWKDCAVDQPPGHPTSKNPSHRGPMCMKWMLLWGEYLASDHDERLETADVERDRGLRYVSLAFQLLHDDLNQKQGLQLARQLYLHSQLDIGVHLFGLPWTSAVLTAELNELSYHRLVWRVLPSTPKAFDVFKFKFETGEWLKQLFVAAKDAPPLSREWVGAATEFFESAYSFHREPAPDPPGQTRTPVWVQARLRGEMSGYGIGYADVPGETGLRPLAALAHTDLEMLLVVLENAAAAKVITDHELAERTESAHKRMATLKISELEDWMRILRRRGDVERVAELQGKVRDVYLQQGDALQAAQEQERLCALLAEIGDAQEWALESVRLAGFRAEAKQWKSALDAVSTVKDALYETSQIPTLVQALSIEQSARVALGLPDLEADWSAKVQAVYKDAVTLPEATQSGAEPLQQKSQQLAAWLAQSGHVLPLRVGAQIQLANALKALNEYSRTELVIRDLRPELERLKRKNTELGLFGGLLELELAEGNVGHFYSVLDDFAKLGRELYGEDWLETTDGQEIANVLYRLGDIHRAETILAAQMELERLDAILKVGLVGFPIASGAEPLVQEEEGLVHEEDSLLQARIDLELGRKEQAEDVLSSLESSTSQTRSHMRVSVGLAEMDAALGKNDRALDKIERALPALDPLRDMSMWVQAKLVQARAQLALGRDASENATRFQQLALHFSEYKELGAQQAIEMEIFLADYYGAQGNATQSNVWLTRGLVLSNELGALDQKIEIYRKLGEAAVRNGDYASAVDRFRECVGLVNSVSTTIPSDLGKVGYRASRNKTIAMLVTTLYTQFQRTRRPEYLEQMFQAAEEGKSRALSDMVFSQRNTERTELKLDDLRKALPADAVLLEYYIPEGVSNVVFRFVIDRSNISVETLPVTALEMTSRVRELKQDATSSADHYDEARFRRKAGELGKILLPVGWSSFEVSGFHRIFVVPAGVLYLFPFSLLADEHGHFLDENENIDVAYMPNAALILRPVPRFDQVNGAVAFVNPERDENHSDFLANNPGLREQFQQSFESWVKATVHWEDPVTVPELLREAAKTDNVFIYAHGRFVPEDPTSSYIRLSDEAGVPNMLSAAELLSAKIGQGMWVLAACSTGSGEVRSGDEVLGLPRALLQAGASMVVISLWDVDLAWSWRFMTEFYHQLASGAPVSRALHAAAAVLRKEGRPPFDWAPFILAGQHGFRKN